MGGQSCFWVVIGEPLYLLELLLFVPLERGFEGGLGDGS